MPQSRAGTTSLVPVNPVSLNSGSEGRSVIDRIPGVVVSLTMNPIE